MAQVIGARLGLTTYTAGTDARPGRAEHNAERNLLEALVIVGGQGTEAARPTAGKARALYWNTERLTLQWDTGTSWQDISTNGGGGPGRAVLVGAPGEEGTSVRSARADHTHSLVLATTTVSGAMSTADKTKLDQAATAATASRLIIRDASGRAQVATPTAAADIANKGYVDSVVGGAAAPTVSLDNNGLATPAMLQATQRVDMADVANSAFSLVVRDADGRTQVTTPVAVQDATPKSYVDSAISTHRHDGGHITTGIINSARLPVVTTAAHGAMLFTDKIKLDQAASGANANSLVMRTPTGTFQAAEPALTGDVATKNYVDVSIGTRAPSNHTHDASAINTGTVAVTRLPTASSSTAGILSSADYQRITNHTHDAASITSGTLGTNYLPYASGSSAGIITAAQFNAFNTLPSHTHEWSSIANRPSTFSPSIHGHAAGDITSGTMSSNRLPYASYSNDGIMTAGAYGTLASATPGVEGGAIVKRWGGGAVSGPAPDKPEFYTTKSYVDGRVSRQAWKTNARPLPYGLTQTSELGARTLMFDYRDEDSTPFHVRHERDVLGAYVEDVAELMPLLATPSQEDGEPESIQDRALLWPVLRSIHELDTRLRKVMHHLGLDTEEEE